MNLGYIRLSVNFKKRQQHNNIKKEHCKVSYNKLVVVQMNFAVDSEILSV